MNEQKLFTALRMIGETLDEVVELLKEISRDMKEASSASQVTASTVEDLEQVIKAKL